MAFPNSGLGDGPVTLRSMSMELDGRLATRAYKTAKLYLRLDEPLSATIYFNKLLKEHPGWELNSQAQVELAVA